MRTSTSVLTAFSLTFGLFTCVNALVLPVRPSSISSRQAANITNAITMVDFQGGDAYLIPISINGQSFDVQLDTGSTDLWVRTTSPIAGTFDSTVSSNLTYGSGSDTGEDKFGTVTIGNFTLVNQVFTEVNPSGQVGESEQGFPGIMGLAPNIGSVLFNTSGQDPRANSTLSNLFTQNEQIEPFFTMQLGRPTEILSATPGTITFGEVLPEFSNITAQPQIPIFDVPALPGFKRWTILLEGMHVNGQSVTLPPSVADSTNSSNFVVLLDSGTAKADVPQKMFDAIYGGIAGAVDKTDPASGETFTMYPCDTEVNVTFTLGGQEYPVHPLDILLPPEEDSNNLCSAAWDANPSNPQLDAIFGDSFLRSVYTLNHFGDTIRGGPNPPYIQVLSAIDIAEAHEQFVQARVNGAGFGVVATDGPPTSTSTDSSADGTASATESSDADATDPATTGPFPISTGTATTDSATGTSAIDPASAASATDSATAATVTDSSDGTSTADSSDGASTTDSSTGADGVSSTDGTATATDSSSDGESVAATATDSATDTDAGIASADSTTTNLSGPTSTDSSDGAAATDPSSADAAATPTDDGDAGSASSDAIRRRTWRSRRH